jgi:hypothetical protein
MKKKIIKILYQIERESRATSGLGRRPASKTRI